MRGESSNVSKNYGFSVFERLYQDSRKKQSSRVDIGNTSKRSESRVSMNSNSNVKYLNESKDYGCLHIY